jgi:hypothetical protein
VSDRERIVAALAVALGAGPAWAGARLGIAGLSGIPRARDWEAFASARCPGISGNHVPFSVPAAGEVVPSTLRPLAEAFAPEIDPPYAGDAVRLEGDLWGGGADRVEVLTLPDATTGDVIEVTSYDGNVDPPDAPPELVAAGEARSEDFFVRAERIDSTRWAVQVYPL